MSSHAQRPRILTGPIIAALVALLALAVATVIVVLTSDSDAKDAGNDGTGNEVTNPSGDPPPSEDPEPDAELVSATDDSFTYTMPEGWADGAEVVNDDVSGVVKLYDTDTANASMPSHIIVASAEDDGTPLESAVDQIQSQFADNFSTTTEDSVIGLTEIDGEQTIGWQSGTYQDGGDVTSTQFAVIHNGTYYFFTVNALPENVDTSREALKHVMETTVWA
ncbi:hypothetical protein [Cumulibacter soli]|uniref:hypothetical protein n=1 Tax=Cumulibacter soli TaxID=2546344 RepID=UPI001067372B|nr:hypothetical protein [Cumulibacter soli]